MPVEGDGLWDKLGRLETWIRVAQNVAMDVSMLWKDLVGGFLIAGFLSAFVPADWWATRFLKGPPPNTIMRLSSDLGKDPDPGKDDESELTDTRD
jgi:hypothetical protein